VKLAYTKNWKTKSWRAHGYYLQREGAQREGERGLGFNQERDDLRLSDLANQWQTAGDPHLFKMIVSPENGHRMDLRQHARDLMKQVELDVGTRLEWAAIDHHNTDNPHVHILIRGRRPDRKPLRFEREYVKHGFRTRSQELATRELGYRREQDIADALKREVQAQRFTSLDRSLLRKADANQTLSFEGTPPQARALRRWRRCQLGRLQFLSELGLARKIGALGWEVSREIPRVLRQIEELRDITKSVARHRPFLRNPNASLLIYQPDEDRVIHGRVVGTGLTNELRGDTYLLVEGRDGFVHYIRQTTAIDRAFADARLHVGDEVVLHSQSFERKERTVRYLAVRQPGLPPLERLQTAFVKPVYIALSRGGRTYSGVLLGYAAGPTYECYAVVDTGTRITAIRTHDRSIPRGHCVEARPLSRDPHHSARESVVTWSLEDIEHCLERKITL
jgi:type IV secretory pathway VirD2 relaxase